MVSGSDDMVVVDSMHRSKVCIGIWQGSKTSKMRDRKIKKWWHGLESCDDQRLNPLPKTSFQQRQLISKPSDQCFGIVKGIAEEQEMDVEAAPLLRFNRSKRGTKRTEDPGRRHHLEAGLPLRKECQANASRRHQCECGKLRLLPSDLVQQFATDDSLPVLTQGIDPRWLWARRGLAHPNCGAM
jgi:hypothetical protein